MTNRFRRPLPLRLQVLGSILAVLLPSMAVMFLYYPWQHEQIARTLFRAQAETITRDGASRSPNGGRIVAIADSYDALTSRRPYKSSWPAESAWQFLTANAGTRFDPDCIAAFLRGRADADATRESFPDELTPERSQRSA